MLDQATGIRKGEELQVEPLQAYLAANIPGCEGELEVKQFPGGFSNLTYLIAMGGKEMVLRRPPFGAKIKSAHDMGREYRVLSGLSKVWDKSPRTLAYTEDESIIGAPFYVMERVKGVILRKPDQALNLSPAVMKSLSESFIGNLAELHGLDVVAAGLDQLGKPEGYVKRQVEGWHKRYQNAQTDDLQGMERAVSWLLENMPEDSGSALIHNDYKYDNMVLDPTDLTRIIAVLDWEMCTLGDPLMDLGTTLAYWVEPDDNKAFALVGLTNLPGNPSRTELLARYAKLTGRMVEHPVFYYTFGLFKLGVIGQQIYYRYKKGFTQDKRFASLIELVRGCGDMAVRAIETDRISNLG
ncbi:MAG: phosphotransferase family protein [Acidobacteriota bacterium]|nr:phosphotransferase family protein [Acidobacteriota bacterium]